MSHRFCDPVELRPVHPMALSSASFPAAYLKRRGSAGSRCARNSRRPRTGSMGDLMRIPRVKTRIMTAENQSGKLGIAIPGRTGKTPAGPAGIGGPRDPTIRTFLPSMAIHPETGTMTYAPEGPARSGAVRSWSIAADQGAAHVPTPDARRENL
jgi:hypothetical protein